MDSNACRRLHDDVSLGSYVKTLSMLIRRPGRFFGCYAAIRQFQIPVIFLLTSCIIGGAASFTQPGEGGVVRAVLFIACSLGLPLFQAILAYVVMLPLTGELPDAKKLSAVFCYSTGVVALMSWLPAFGFVAESGKWILAGIGLLHVFNLKPAKALLAVVLVLFLQYGLVMLIMK